MTFFYAVTKSISRGVIMFPDEVLHFVCSSCETFYFASNIVHGNLKDFACVLHSARMTLKLHGRKVSLIVVFVTHTIVAESIFTHKYHFEMFKKLNCSILVRTCS